MSEVNAVSHNQQVDVPSSPRQYCDEYGDDYYMDEERQSPVVDGDIDDHIQLYGDVEFNMEKVEQIEMNKTNDILLESEFRPYMEQYDFEEEYEKKVQLRLSGAHDRPRYFSAGYEANVDPPDDLEIARWQKNFHFLHVIGEGVDGPELDESICDTMDQSLIEGGEEEEENQPIVFEPTKKRNAELDLSIYGKRMKIQQMVINSNIFDALDEEEIFAQHGVLEEYLDIDNSTSVQDIAEDESVKEEISNELVEQIVHKIWPKLLPTLEPTVLRVVNKSRELHLPTNIIDRKAFLADKFGFSKDDTNEYHQCDSFW